MFILIFVISQSLHWRCLCLSYCSVNPNLASWLSIISDSCWFAFCFAYSVEKQVPEEQIYGFLKVQSSAAHHGWDELIVAGCCFVTLAGPIQTQSESRYLIISSSSRRAKSWLRIGTDLLFLPFTCYLRSESLLYWCEFQFFIVLSQLLIIWTYKTCGEHCLGTSRMSIVMFAGKSAKC